MNRADLQKLSDERIEDSRALIVAQQWSGAYYLAGYALECALKSCVLAYIDRTGIVFVDKKYSEKCWTHKIEELVQLAELNIDRNNAIKTNTILGQNWMVAKDWSESSRYRTNTQSHAEILFKALTDNLNGVLPWVRNFW